MGRKSGKYLGAVTVVSFRMWLEATSAVLLSCATAGRQSPLPLSYQWNLGGQEETQVSFLSFYLIKDLI